MPDRVTAFNQSHAPAPAHIHQRDPAIEPASDDWPFLYLRDRQLPSHYSITLALVLVVSAVVVLWTTRGQGGRWSWQFFLLGAGFMLLESKSIIQFALLWGSTWVVASLAIASVLTMALVANFIVAATEIRRPWLVGSVLVALLIANYLIPIGRIGFENRALESLFYAVLVFSPILCAGLLFGSGIKRSTSLARDYGTNLLGAMLGGVGEYLSLVTGFRVLLFLIAACYIGALLARGREQGSLAIDRALTEGTEAARREFTHGETEKRRRTERPGLLGAWPVLVDGNGATARGGRIVRAGKHVAGRWPASRRSVTRYPLANGRGALQRGGSMGAEAASDCGEKIHKRRNGAAETNGSDGPAGDVHFAFDGVQRTVAPRRRSPRRQARYSSPFVSRSPFLRLSGFSGTSAASRPSALECRQKGDTMAESDQKTPAGAGAQPGITRRSFVTTAAAAGAGIVIVPRHVLGRGFQAPSDTHERRHCRHRRHGRQQRPRPHEPEHRRDL